MQAAHGWLEQEAQGETDDGNMNSKVKLAFPEWVRLQFSPADSATCHVSLARACAAGTLPAVVFPFDCCQHWRMPICRSTTRRGRAKATCTTWSSTSRCSFMVGEMTPFALQRGTSLALAQQVSAGWHAPRFATVHASPVSPGRIWPEEDKGEVELLLMLISHICGALLGRVRPCRLLTLATAQADQNLPELVVGAILCL